MKKRAESLVERIETGAQALADFARGLSEREWSTPVRPDGRTAGVIVHHVASMYPIEIHVATVVASGNAVTDVTWDAVAEINAKHAAEFANAGKEETLALLLRNSKVAADAVRALTDEQLDRAAPFSLNAGAPLTAQFVIEDHALRHSWHHLAKIKAALQTRTTSAAS